MPYPNKSAPKAVLFDWDNTLVDTMPLICDSINHALAHFGFDPWSRQEIQQKTQHSAKDSLPGYFGDRWEEALTVYRDFYQKNHLDLLKPLTGAADLLDILTEQKIPMALVSNKVGSTLRLEVQHLGWQGYFLSQIGSGDAAHDKPSPDPALLALQTLKIPSSQDIWFVGDAPVDWQCAQAAGCWPIPIGFEHDEASFYPQAVQNSIDLQKILQNL